MGLAAILSTVCVDASLILAQLLPETLSEASDAVMNRWRDEDVELVAPPMLALEVPSVLRQSIHRGRISLNDGDEAFESFLALRIRISNPDRLVAHAWELGKTLDSARLYDMYYLALAEIENCELWTADRRLANLAEGRPVAVRWVGDYPKEPVND